MTGFPEPPEGDSPIVRDRRRIDPTTHQVREGVATAAPSTPGPVPEGSPADGGVQATTPASAELDEVQGQLAERTADLQRVQAEYANYRRRVERDRQAVAEQALASVLVGLLPVLDDVDRAKAHGESSQGFTLLADGLETTLTKLGLQRFGDAGEPFDPTVHEALTHGFSAEVTEPTCAEIFQAGYRVGERTLRPARVAVVEPGGAPTAEGTAASATDSARDAAAGEALASEGSDDAGH